MEAVVNYKSIFSKENIITGVVVFLTCLVVAISLQPVELALSAVNAELQSLMLVTLIVAGILSFIGERTVNPNLLDLIVLIWTLYTVLHIYLYPGFPCATFAIQSFQMVLLYITLRILFSASQIKGNIIAIILIACASYEALFGLLQCTNGYSRHHLYLMTGTFLNPGPYSAYLTLGVILCCDLLRSSDRVIAWLKPHKLNWLIYLSLLLCSALIPATWSRAALVSLVVTLLLMFRDKCKKYLILILLMAICLGSFLYVFKQGSADGRILIWIASFTTWIHSPIFGTGIGSFLHSCSEGICELYTQNPHSPLLAIGGVTEYAFNDSLKVIVEQGAIGGILCIELIVSVLYRLYHLHSGLFYGLLGLLAFSLFSYPFELLPYQIIFVTMAAWSGSAEVRSFKRVKIIPITITMWTLCIPLCLTLSHAINIYHSADKEARLFAGLKHQDFIKDYYELLPLKRDDSRFLFDFGQTLRYNRRYNDSNDILRQGSMVSADPMFYVLIGNNYKDMGHFDLADEAYNKAFSVMPNRLYPLYQLMRLHWDAGELAKAREYASRIVSFKEKIPSPATEQMKQEAKEYLYNHKQYKQNQTATDSI